MKLIHPIIPLAVNLFTSTRAENTKLNYDQVVQKLELLEQENLQLTQLLEQYEENDNQIDIGIIGGGITGLSFIYYLHQQLKAHPEKLDKVFNVNLFEAQDRFGGRMRSVLYGKNVTVDYPNFGPLTINRNIFRYEMGAEFIDKKHYNLRKLAANFGVKFYESTTGIYKIKKLNKALYNSMVPWEFQYFHGHLSRGETNYERFHEMVSCYMPGDNDAEKENKTVLEVLNYCKADQDLIDLFVSCESLENGYNYGIDRLSWEDYLYHIILDDEAKLLNICSVDELHVYKRGTRNLINKLHKYALNIDHPNLKVSLAKNAPVATINESKYPTQKASTEVIFKSGQVMNVDKLILTAPVMTYNRLGEKIIDLNFMGPQMSKKQNIYLDNISLGKGHKFWLLFSEKFWRNEENIKKFGDYPIFEILTDTFNLYETGLHDRVYMNKNFYSLHAFYTFKNDDIQDWIDGTFDQDAFIKHLLQEVEDAGFVGAKDSFITYFSPKLPWMANPYIQGCYIGQLPLEATLKGWKGAQEQRVGDNFFFGGAEWTPSPKLGYMEGALVSSQFMVETIFNEQ